MKGKFDKLSPSKALDRGSSEASNIQTLKRSGKATNKEEYQGTTIYLQRALHKRVRVKLMEQDGELSELVERLLTGWLEAQ